jgi:hypothetical protein
VSVPRNDLTGRRFDRLKVTKYLYHLNGRPYWLCRCDCGNEHVVRHDALLKGNTKSCGCLRGESSRMRLKQLWGDRE